MAYITYTDPNEAAPYLSEPLSEEARAPPVTNVPTHTEIQNHVQAP